MKKLGTPIFEQVIDDQSSILMPHYDPETHLLYFAGKGDSSIFFSELTNTARIFAQLGVYRDVESQKGGGWVPKRGLNTKKCEIGRFLKLTAKSVIPVSFIVPRKIGAEIH